jgi:isoquinoline 1-oxidoreductase beta subunit
MENSLAVGGAHPVGRRDFVRVVALAGGGLAVALVHRPAAGSRPARPPTQAADVPLGPWVRITTDDRVTILVSQAEMGQGISTTLPAVLADELDARWADVRLETTPFAPAYRNPSRNWMFTGNSESVQAFYDLMRRTGATVRTMLIAAAATRWQVPAAECRATDGVVTHAASGRRASFGELADAAARITPPDAPALKADRDLRLIGRALPRVDVPVKVDGSAQFGIDIVVPGMLIAAVRTAPTLLGSVRRYDEGAARRMPGVVGVVPVPRGIAVVADTWWHARRGLDALQLEVDPGPTAEVDSALIEARYACILDDGPWATPVLEGDVAGRLRAARRTVSATYFNPFLAHATMEPMNCTARVTAEVCEIWAPTQGQELATHALAAALQMPLERISVRRSDYLGGGFGRRLLPDFVVQAALVSRAVQAPVKLIWAREEDTRRDYFRPASTIRLTAALDALGRPAAVHARVVSPTILAPVAPAFAEQIATSRVDPSALEGMLEMSYAFPARQVDFHLFDTPIPTSVLRTTGYGPNTFALESFVDELALAAREDPYAYRRHLLRRNLRGLAVLDRAARLARWGTPLAAGRGRGLAYAHAFGSLIAQVAQVTVRGESLRVERVVSVVDPGRVLDPGIAAATIEGGVVFGLAGAMSEITFVQGSPRATNFNRNLLPALADAPDLVTEFIEGGGALGGLGEVSPVTIPAAVANAVFAATGRRLRSMPIGRHGLRFA